MILGKTSCFPLFGIMDYGLTLYAFWYKFVITLYFLIWITVWCSSRSLCGLIYMVMVDNPYDFK